VREAPDTGAGVGAEPIEPLQSPHDRLAAAADRLGQSLRGFIRSRAYDTIQQRHGRLYPAPLRRIAVITATLWYAESIRTMIFPVQPQSRAASGVLITEISGFRPVTSRFVPAIFAWPNDAPSFW
jgi:hypothetical protein